MSAEPETTSWPRRWLEEAERLDIGVYNAIAGTETPQLDIAMSRLTQAANYSRLSLAAAAGLAVLGGPTGRRAATKGLISLGLTAAIVNAAIKPLSRRARPQRADDVPAARLIEMPRSRSFPSGHSAGAFAFATGVGHESAAAGVPLQGLAALVAYSRVHTGVHYPADVLAGGLIGVVLARLTTRSP